MASRTYQNKDLKLLWGLAAGRCAFPGCRLECILQRTEQDPTAVIGEIAHIVAHGDSGPRADPSFPAALRDHYENLILLCPTDHSRVDVHENAFTVVDLQKWKRDHERWVRESLAREIPAVGFAELEIVTKALLGAALEPVTTFTITNPALKMTRNGLTQRTHFLLAMGLAKAKEVEKFVISVAAVQEGFPEELKAGFVAEYVGLRSEGYEGDALFEALHQFASGSSREFRRQAAGIAVLAYLFEKCEVFEA